jgi:hypothetical protein
LKKKKEKRSGKKDMRGMNQEKEKNKSARKDVTLLGDETFTLFSNHVQSDNEDIIGAS